MVKQKKKKKRLSATQIQKICKNAGIILEEYDQRSLEDLVFKKIQKQKKEEENNEEAERRLERNLKK